MTPSSWLPTSGETLSLSLCIYLCVQVFFPLIFFSTYSLELPLVVTEMFGRQRLASGCILFTGFLILSLLVFVLVFFFSSFGL